MVFLLIMLTFAQLFPTSSNFPVAKPGCADTCGGVSIPFPFGTTADCYHYDSFRVTCNSTFNPPKLFLHDTATEITHISLDGHLRIMHAISKICYAPDGRGSGAPVSGTSPSLSLPTHMNINNTANKFTIVGCDTNAFIYGLRRRGRTYTTGCTATCDAVEDLTEGECTGLGCCQTSIPGDVWEVNVDLITFNNYSFVMDFDSCGFAFLVEEDGFSFSPQNLTNLGSVEEVPLIVDWAVGNETCEEAASATYACVSENSGCYNPRNGDGYRCHCRDGYQGNAYLVHGCQDIDECAGSDLHDCMDIARCVNTAGNYTCSCPKGYSGDGRGPNGCKDIDECANSSLNKCEKNELCTNTEGSYTCRREQDTKIAYILIGVAFGTTLLLVAAIFSYIELKRRSSKRKRRKFFLDNGGILLQQKLTTRQTSPHTVKIFTSSELRKATNAFHSSMIVGQGGFGTVYRGVLSDKTTVAIKKSKKVDPTQIEQFVNEVCVLSQVNHRNVVRLLGCCLETEAPLLVYEYVRNGALSAHLHNKAKSRFLNWEMRLRIAAETAGVLAYLHSAASTPIIHRDVKTDNILLDLDYTAKVSDFGASKLVPLDLTQLSTMVQGTFGYLDPEYMQTSQLTEKSDVYSFGVVLLELLTGRKAISFEKPEIEKSLANFFLSMMSQDCLDEILDENIVGDADMEHVVTVARLAKECLNVRGENRPSMKQVAMELEGLIVGGKYCWGRNEKVEEMQLFFYEEGKDAFANGESNAASQCYTSIWGRLLSRSKGAVRFESKISVNQ